MASCQVVNAQVFNFDILGNWNYTIPPNDILEAGYDFSGTYESANNQIYLSVYLNGGWIGLWWNYFINYSWQIEVSRIDTDWHPDITVMLRRTGDGSGIGGGNYIAGGANYIEVAQANQHFCEGARARLDVPLQLQLKGISVTMPAKNYTTTIVYTITSTF